MVGATYFDSNGRENGATLSSGGFSEDYSRPSYQNSAVEGYFNRFLKFIYLCILILFFYYLSFFKIFSFFIMIFFVFLFSFLAELSSPLPLCMTKMVVLTLMLPLLERTSKSVSFFFFPFFLFFSFFSFFLPFTHLLPSCQRKNRGCFWNLLLCSHFWWIGFFVEQWASSR